MTRPFDLRAMRGAGASIRETAKTCGVSVRWVSQLTAAAKPDNTDKRQNALPL